METGSFDEEQKASDEEPEWENQNVTVMEQKEDGDDSETELHPSMLSVSYAQLIEV